jgi:hypothetical protein
MGLWRKVNVSRQQLGRFSRTLALLVAPVLLGGCLQCLGSQFTFAYFANGVLTSDSSSIQAPAAVEMSASSRFEPTCGNTVVVSKVAFYAGSQLLAVDSSAPFEYTWNVQPGKDGVPSVGTATLEIYAIANDQYTSGKPKLDVRVTAVTRGGGRVPAIQVHSNVARDLVSSASVRHSDKTCSGG